MLAGFIHKVIARCNLDEMVSEGDILKLVQRDKFSNLLPYIAYDPESHAYITSDDKLAFIYECLPLTYGSEEIHNSLELIINTVPYGTVLQAILYADDDIEHVLEHYQYLRKDAPAQFQVIPERTAQLFRDAARHGFKNIANIPARVFRLFFCVKLPLTSFDDNTRYLRDSMHESLSGANLCPSYMAPGDLCRVLQRIFNDETDLPPRSWNYNEQLPIRKQIIMGGTRTKIEFDHIRLGQEKYVSLQTIREYPESISDLTINEALGGVFGASDDGNQLNFPFLASTNIVVEDLKSFLHAKTNASMFQEKKGSSAKHKMTKEQELIWAVSEAESGVRFVRVIPSIMTFARSREQLSQNVSKVQGLFVKKGKGFTINNDKGILAALFLLSLPLGLYPTKLNLEWLERDRIMPASSAARLLPTQADYSGIGRPVTILKGRKGQVVAFDIFDKELPNQNGFIAASTGSGKSYFCNRLIMDMRSIGAVIRVVDLGKSFRKLCRLLEGNFLEFTPEVKVCLNPFTNVKDLDAELGNLSDTINQMVWSATGQKPNETQVSLVKAAIRQVWDDYGPDALDQIDRIQLCLTNVKEILRFESEFASDHLRNIQTLGAELAFNLEEFTSRGAYGRWFHGRSTLDIEQDEFVVLELDELYKQRELFNVVVMQIINYMSNNLYLSDRSKPRMHLFDEAWMWADGSSFVGNSIIRGYRTARKYYGGFFSIYQSLADLDCYGEQKHVLVDNSAWTFLLRGEKYDARQDEIMGLSPFQASIVRSMSLMKGKYSEVFVKNPFNAGVVRLPNDKFTHLVCTSDPKDNEMIMNVANHHNVSEIEAIRILTEQQE